MPKRLLTGACAALIAAGCAPADVGPGTAGDESPQASAAAGSGGVPQYEVDTSWQWPPALPGGAAVGVVTYVAVDRRDHVWVLHRSRQVPAELRQRAAPPVLEFDADGNFVQAWGGPAEGYDWPDTEHGLYVDHEDNVWITGLNPLEQAYTDPTDRTDDMILKFTSSGEFLGQFGGRDRHPLGQGGNADTDSVHLATEAVVFPETNELFVADGYANRRVLVLDAQTLQFKRMWGAFGNQPLPDLGRDASPTSAAADMDLTVDPDGPDIFNSVHALKVSNDGLVYVGDRNHRRIQVFTLDGEYVEQGFINLDGADNMTACGLDFSPDPQQEFIYVGDYGNGHVHIVRRDTLEVVGSFGDLGPDRGDFRGLHTLAVDSQGNIWTAETQPRPVGSRVQRFRLQ
ncbi:MAG: hypothetical protein OXF27_16380 [Acidobacteria bacterium]|nr:hypothetical protein [Acidobacteriota bacterium]